MDITLLPGSHNQQKAVQIQIQELIDAAGVSTAQQAALDLKANIASPTLTGIPAAPTAAPGTNTTQLATTAFVDAAAASKAPLASPTFTGIPAAPTAAPGTNTTQIATTAFAKALGDTKAPLDAPALTGIPTAATAALGTNTTQLATTAFTKAAVDDAVGFKVYTALLTQTGVAAPVATVLKNNLGGTVSFTYTAVGSYVAVGSANSLFPVAKTVVLMGPPSIITQQIGAVHSEDVNNKEIFIKTGSAEVAANAILKYTAIEIRVYP